MSPTHEHAGGLTAAWAATVASLLNSVPAWVDAIAGRGISINAILTAVLTVTTIIWTVERTRTERAKRRAIEGYADTQPGAIKRLMERISTRRGDL